jgi:hypothetical protein
MAQSIPAIPFKWPLLISLALAWCWSQIAWSVGANALAKSHRDKNYIKQLVGPAVDVHFHTQDVFDTGVIITAITALFAFGFTIFLSGFLIPSTRHIAIKYLRFHAYLLFFFDTWLLATLIAYTYFVAKRRVQITAYTGGYPLPQSSIYHAEQDSGLKFEYKELGYLKIVAILPWFTFLFTLIAAVIMYIASTIVEPTPYPAVDSSQAQETSPAEKEYATERKEPPSS